MKLIRTQDAVGHVLCHDMTQIIPGQYKDARFRKGHVVREEDIPVLLSMGKENLYVWEMVPGMVHENDAAERLCALCGNRHMIRSQVKEGKLELSAAMDGLFRVDTARLNQINLLEDIMVATRHGNRAVRKGDKLCGTRVIPLVIEEEKLSRAEDAAGDAPLLDLCYEEDSGAMVDLNCVMNDRGELVELQGTGEGRGFTVAEQRTLVDLCQSGIRQLLEKQKEILGGQS